MPPVIWLNPYLTWGGNERGELVSGRGNFGNVLCFENVEKSVASGPFVSLGHFKMTNKHAWYDLSRQAARYATHPTWGRIVAMSAGAVAGRFRPKDF
jgi:hypothetical protein